MIDDHCRRDRDMIEKNQTNDAAILLNTKERRKKQMMKNTWRRDIKMINR